MHRKLSIFASEDIFSKATNLGTKSNHKPTAIFFVLMYMRIPFVLWPRE